MISSSENDAKQGRTRVPRKLPRQLRPKEQAARSEVDTIIDSGLIYEYPRSVCVVSRPRWQHFSLLVLGAGVSLLGAL